MNKPASELIALADDPQVVAAAQQAIMNHPFFEGGAATAFGLARAALKAVAANQSGRRPGVDALREALVTARECIWSGGNTISTLKTIDTALATPPAQPAPAAAHGKPDGAVRECADALLEICDGSNWPEEAQSGVGFKLYQELTEQLHDIALTLMSTALHSPKIAAAETSPGDVLAMKEACKRIAQPWREITEDDEPPRDVELLLGWWRTWPERKWEAASGLYGSTKGGWVHGNATHWMHLPAPPASKDARS